MARRTGGSYPSHFVLGGGAGVDEGLSDDGQHGVDAVAHLDVQDELRVLQDVHPEPKWQAEHTGVGRSDRKGGAERGRSPQVATASPVGLPDVNRLRVVDAVLLRHVVQEVEEEADGDGRRPLGAEDRYENVVYKLLQCPLQAMAKQQAALRLVGQLPLGSIYT